MRKETLGSIWNDSPHMIGGSVFDDGYAMVTHHSTVTHLAINPVQMGLTSGNRWEPLSVASCSTTSLTLLCNRPSGIFAFSQWILPPLFLVKFLIIPGRFVASPVRLLHTQHISFVFLWKRQNSDLTEMGNLVENLLTRWRFSKKPGGNIDATGSVILQRGVTLEVKVAILS